MRSAVSSNTKSTKNTSSMKQRSSRGRARPSSSKMGPAERRQDSSSWSMERGADEERDDSLTDEEDILLQLLMKKKNASEGRSVAVSIGLISWPEGGLSAEFEIA